MADFRRNTIWPAQGAVPVGLAYLGLLTNIAMLAVGIAVFAAVAIYLGVVSGFGVENRIGEPHNDLIASRIDVSTAGNPYSEFSTGPRTMNDYGTAAAVEEPATTQGRTGNNSQNFLGSRETQILDSTAQPRGRLWCKGG